LSNKAQLRLHRAPLSYILSKIPILERTTMTEQDLQQDEVLVRTIDKGLGNRIHIRISRFKDRDYLDIRNYYEDDAGEWKPTRKGIAVPVEFYDELIESLTAAKEEIAKRAKDVPAAEKEEPASE